MTNEPSPRPWRVEDDQIVDANGLAVTPIDGGAVVSSADAALIVDAVNEYARRENRRKKYIDRRVNDAARIEGLYADISDLEAERDRLRDIVKRFAKIVGEAPIDWFGASLVDTQVLLNEARTAIGEHTP